MRRMRYHLNIRNGSDLIEDWEGAEHPDLESAVREAIASARDMLAECLRSGSPFGDRKFEIRDENYQLVHVLPFVDALPFKNSRMLARRSGTNVARSLSPDGSRGEER